MNKLTIVFDDNSVGQDGVFYSPIDLSSAPAGIHALQWNGTKGWIEYSVDSDGNKQTNLTITELPDWVSIIQENWNAANSENHLK